MGRHSEEVFDLGTGSAQQARRSQRLRRVAFAAFAALVLLTGKHEVLLDGVAWARYQLTPLPSDPLLRAHALLQRHPLIDGHIDLPILARAAFRNQIDLEKPTRGQIDIPRLRAGGVGGFFWSVYVPCPDDAGYPRDNDGNFTTPTWRTRDTLEQIDVAKLIIAKHSDTFEYTPTAKSWKKAMKKGKIGGMLGVEGLGMASLLWTAAPLLMLIFGFQILDLSHTDPSTASDALTHSLSPPIFSHSNARGVHNAVRNVPDSILRRIGATSKKGHCGGGSLRSVDVSLDGEGGKGWGSDSGEATKPVPSGDSIIMLNFSPGFVSEWDDGSEGGVRADVAHVADHADYIGRLAGREHVGVGSDFDGIANVPEGLEDASKYPALIAELIARGWTDSEIAGLTGGNILRIIEKVEAVAYKLRHEPPVTDIFDGRTDMQRREW
ncbi:hypothetical protein RQP46_005982 [Phenoliferia psychrophenolica]